MVAQMANRAELLFLSDDEKIRRFDAMVKRTFCHLDGRDLLKELHPRRTLNIKRRVDGVETWYEGDWLTYLMEARDKPTLKQHEYSDNGVKK